MTIGIFFDFAHHPGELVNFATVFGGPAPPHLAVDARELAVHFSEVGVFPDAVNEIFFCHILRFPSFNELPINFIGVVVPDVDTIINEIFNVGSSGIEPVKFVEHAFPIHFFRRKERETVFHVKTDLPTEDAVSGDARALINLLYAFVQDFLEKVQILIFRVLGIIHVPDSVIVYHTLKAFIIAALTADGFIAKDARHPAFWTSKEDKKFFAEMTKKAGVVIMGRTTYETIGRPLKDRLNIVYSRKGGNYHGVEVTAEGPAELFKNLEARGYSEAAIMGGSSIYTMFMASGMVQKLYLTVSPLVFGQGVNLFSKAFEKKLKLESVEKLGEETVLMEYSIIN